MMAIRLPWASQPLWNCKSERHMLAHMRRLARQAGSGTDETHVASKNINELRQLIHKASTKHLSHASYPRVISCLKERAVGMIQMKNLINTLGSSTRHCSELVQDEPSAPHTKPLLQEKGRTWAA